MMYAGDGRVTGAEMLKTFELFKMEISNSFMTWEIVGKKGGKENIISNLYLK